MGLIDVLKEKLTPTDALVFYDSKMGKYVEHRNIVNGQMMAGQPLEVKQFTKMVKLVESYAKNQQEITQIRGVIPSNLLYANPNFDSMKLVWWRGPEKRKMYFVKDLKIPNGEMTVPGLVYCTFGGGLHVWAFKGKKPKGLLYRAPFFNVYSNGTVCLGSSKTTKPKNNTFEEWMQYWEKMFWQSEFAHLISGNPIKGNLAVLTKKCIEEGKAFPVDVMKRTNVKLNDILK